KCSGTPETLRKTPAVSPQATYSDPAYGSLLHQELAGTSHSKTINPGTYDPLEIMLIQGEQHLRLGPQCGEEDGTILGFRKDQHLVEHEFYGNQFETKAQG
ncbi:MAG: hypothetical protein RLZZ34_1916, partial [Verrucomicrobiota bacterium]